MNSPLCTACWAPKQAAHSPMYRRASSIATLSENAAWKGRCQLSWNSASPRLVPQPKLPRQTKSSAKNSPMSSMRWSLSASTIASMTRRVSSVLLGSVSRERSACSGRLPLIP